MGHSIFPIILKKNFFCFLLALLISNIEGNIFLNSSKSGSKPWVSLVLLQKAFKNYCTIPHFPNLEKLSNCIHLHLCVNLHTFTFITYNISAQLRMRKESLKKTGTGFFKKTAFLKIDSIFYLDHKIHLRKAVSIF